MKFIYQADTWIYDGAIDEQPDFGSVYKDKTWQEWYDEGNSTLKKILDLGPNVRFKYIGKDGSMYTYEVYASKAAMRAGGIPMAGGEIAASGGSGAGISSAAAWIIGGSAVVAGAVIISEEELSIPQPPPPIEREEIVSRVFGIQLGNPQERFLNMASTNIGLNFSGGGREEVAVFGNASSLAFQDGSPFHASTNYSGSNPSQNFSYATHCLYKGSRSRFDLGALWIDQRSPVEVITEKGNSFSFPVSQEEYTLNLTWAYRFDERFSLGLSSKLKGQDLDLPVFVEIENIFAPNNQVIDRNIRFINESIEENVFDLDLSSTYRFSDSWDLGIVVLNSINNKLFNEPGKEKSRSTRLFATGTSFKWKNNVLGLDFVYPEEGGSYFATGWHLKIKEDWSTGIGYSEFEDSLITTIRWRGISLSYHTALEEKISVGFTF